MRYRHLLLVYLALGAQAYALEYDLSKIAPDTVMTLKEGSNVYFGLKRSRETILEQRRLCDRTAVKADGECFRSPDPQFFLGSFDEKSGCAIEFLARGNQRNKLNMAGFISTCGGLSVDSSGVVVQNGNRAVPIMDVPDYEYRGAGKFILRSASP